MDEARIETGGGPGEDSDQLTSIHVHQAIQGDHDSLAWVVRRFTPVLTAQARYRLQGGLRKLYDPEDLVNDVWTVALPKLSEAPDVGSGYTRMLMKFLSTILLYRFNNLVRKHVRENETRGGVVGQDRTIDELGKLPADTLGVVTRAVHDETRESVVQGVEGLEPTDREVIILHGIEQIPARDVADMLGTSAEAVAMRYSRALKKLRARLGPSIFDEFNTSF